MNANEINQTFDLVAYVGAIVKLIKKKNYFAGPCPMCGGRDRFTIKRTDGDIWICRKCGSGKYRSAIDFVMQYNNLDFKQAVERMGGEIQKPTPIAARPVRPAPVQVAPDPEWQSQAWHQVDIASDRLLERDAGEPGRQYLAERGISRASMYMSMLGYGIVYKRPAIFIPYIDLGDVITAVKYRFIDERARKDKGARFAMMSGSLPYLFGLQHILESQNILLFVEGELNAISVLQIEPRRAAVVSTGSESNGNADLLYALAARFEKVVIWMDDPAKALIVRGRMGKDAHLIKSPIIENKKWDANEMLKAGILGEFLNRQFASDSISSPLSELRAEIDSSIDV